MQNSTFTCDGCDNTIPEGAEVHRLTLFSKSVDGAKEVHLDDECLDNFMDGSLSGNDLFLQD